MPSAWRLRLDVPYDFPVEQGYVRATHCHNFRPGPGGMDGCWRCPVTGVVMLEPSFLNENFYDGASWWPLTSWTHDVDYWQSIWRDPSLAAGTANFFSSVRPPTVGLINQLVDINTWTLTFVSGLTNDAMKWVLASTETLSRDESFVVHVRTLADEHHRYHNWFAVKFGRIGLAFRHNGIVRAYEYGDDDTLEPTLIDEFQIATAGELANKEHQFAFIPMPGIGLVVYYLSASPHSKTRSSSALSGVSRGHVVRYSAIPDGAGAYYLHDGGEVLLGMGGWTVGKQMSFGFHRIRFAASGGFTDAVFDPGFKPTTDPDAADAIRVPNGRGTLFATLRNAKDDADWAAGTDRQGRMNFAMSTADSKYTPMLYGSYVRWLPVRATRDTTVVDPEGVNALEFTEDDQGRFEGRADVRMETAAQRKIVERGDTTFVIERCDDPAAETPVWVTQSGGFARVQPGARFRASGYDATLELHGMEARFDEVTQVLDTAFDGVTPGDSINVVLTACGFTPIDAGDMPAAATAFAFPTVSDTQEWKLGPQAGDHGSDIIYALLLFLRKQNQEFILRHDWDLGYHVLELRPKVDDEEYTWLLTAYCDEKDVDALTIPIGGPDGVLYELTPIPPEANLVQPYGIDSANSSDASRVPGTPLVNVASLGDPDSLDYLGRVVAVYPFFAPVADVPTINVMGRRVFEAISRHRAQILVKVDDYYHDLSPSTHCTIRGPLADQTRGTLWASLWVRRRTVRLEKCVLTSVALALDSRWESEVDP